MFNLVLIQYTANRMKKITSKNFMLTGAQLFTAYYSHIQQYTHINNFLFLFFFLIIDDLWFLLTNLISNANGANCTFYFFLYCVLFISKWLVFSCICFELLGNLYVTNKFIFHLTYGSHSILLSCTIICNQLVVSFFLYFCRLFFLFFLLSIGKIATVSLCRYLASD